MAQPDLELFITPGSADSYGLTLRFRHPGAGLDKSWSGAWTLDAAALRQHEQDPTTYGEVLAAQLLAGVKARNFLDEALAVADSESTPLRLRLFIAGKAEALHSLHWETLRLPGSDAPLAMSEWVRISRHLDSKDWRPVRATERKSLRALVVVASPDVTGTTLAEVRTDEELRRAEEGLGEISTVKLAGRGRATLQNLLASLRKGCDILFLVAHGMLVDGEPKVLLEQSDGGRAWISGRELATCLGGLEESPGLAVLISCQSAGSGEHDGSALAGLGPLLASAGVPAVLAMQGLWTMETSATFMPLFLTELRRDGQVDRAAAVARGAVRSRPDWWMPVLFSRLEDGRLFRLPQAADDPLFDLPSLPSLDLPDAPFRPLDWYRREDAEIFFGRGKEIRKLYDRINSPHGHPIVLLYGQSGVGKSSLLAAGLLPRLEKSHEVRYTRRDLAQGLLGTLVAALGAPPGADLATAWRDLEIDTGKPLLAVLDQVEEVWTRPNLEQPSELAVFLDALMGLFGDLTRRPQGRLLLGFRKEWLAEIDQRLVERKNLPHVNVFLERLGRAGIAEVVSGPKCRNRLDDCYGLEVSDGLPGLIADDLLADRDSPVAPMLAILLADLWEAAKTKRYDRPVFSEELYQEFCSRGLSLDDFLRRKLETLSEQQPAAVKSGLALDVLAYHTTPLGTAEQRTLEDLEQIYRHRQDALPALVQACRDLYLLVDPSENKPELSTPNRLGPSRLTHDTLAPHVRRRFDESDAPGQRARRILESRVSGREDNELLADTQPLAPLGDADLAVVLAGRDGMRVWKVREEELVQASEADRARRREEQERVAKEREEARLRELKQAQLLAEEQRLRAEEGEKAAAEKKVQQQRELEQAHLLTEEQRLRAEEGEKAAGRLRRWLIAVAVLGAVALIASIASVCFGLQAEAQRSAAQKAAESETVARGMALEELANSQRNESLLLSEQAQKSLQEDTLLSIDLSARALPGFYESRPYVPEAEFALTQALRANLEEGYYFHQDALLQFAGQIGFGPTSIAVGGKNPWLLGYNLEPITSQAILSDVVLGMEWRVTDAMPDRLLTYDENSVDILEVTADGVHHSGAQQVECLAAAHCAGWRPASEDVLILDGASVKLWTSSTDITETLPVVPEDKDLMKGFDWTDDGQRLAVWDSSDNLWVWEAGNVVTLPITGTREARFVDSNHLVLLVEGNSSAVQLVSVDGIEREDFPTGDIPFDRIELSTDRSQLAAASSEGHTHLYDVASRQKLHEFPVVFTALAWPDPDLDYSYTAVGVMDGSIHIFSQEDGAEVMVLRGHKNGEQGRADVLRLKWMLGGRLLSAGMDGSLRLWRVFDAQGQPLCNTDSSGAPKCRTLNREFTEGTAAGKRGEFPVHWLDDSTAVFLDAQGRGWRWSLTGDAAGDKVEPIRPPSEIQKQPLLVGQPGGVYVLQYAENGDGQIWNAQNGDEGRQIAGPIVRADWPDWQEDGPLVVRRDGNDLQIYIGYSGSIPLPMPFDDATVEAMAVRGDELAVGWSTGLIQIWDYKTANGSTTPKTLRTDDGDLVDLQWDSREPRLLVTQKFTATLWNASNQQQLWEWPSESELAAGPIRITGAALSSDGCCVAIMSGKTLYVVDMNGRTVQTITPDDGGHQNTIKALRWITGRAWPGQTPEPDQQRPQFLVTWSGDRTARVWYWDTNGSQLKEVWRVAEPVDLSVDAGSVNNDGSWILTVSEMGTLRAWQAWVNHPEVLIEAAQRALSNAGDRRLVDEIPK